MPTIYIDNKPYEVKAGKNLLEACLAQGVDIPYFCWHPSLGSVGACRQCAVKLFKDEKRMSAIRKQMMQIDHSWENSAGRYIDLYTL